MTAVIADFGQLPAYGWDSIDAGNRQFNSWKDWLSFDVRCAGGGGHTLDLFQENGHRIVDFAVWFDSLRVSDFQGDRYRHHRFHQRRREVVGRAARARPPHTGPGDPARLVRRTGWVRWARTDCPLRAGAAGPISVQNDAARDRRRYGRGLGGHVVVTGTGRQPGFAHLA
jgi:hypothetical protein